MVSIIQHIALKCLVVAYPLKMSPKVSFICKPGFWGKGPVFLTFWQTFQIPRWVLAVGCGVANQASAPPPPKFLERNQN
jgi:hypothetical protein